MQVKQSGTLANVEHPNRHHCSFFRNHQYYFCSC